MNTVRTALLSGLLAAGTLCGAEYFVAANGLPSGNGSADQPWDLATALKHPPTVRPGDTIWVRGGRYVGPFRSELTGRTSAPIVVRRYRDERVILDGAGSQLAALNIFGGATWYWGLEITNSNTQRVVPDFRSCYPNCRGGGVTVFGADVKCINLIVHDTGEGVGLWTLARNAELYGTIVFFTGWQSDIRGHGHGIYMQNDTGTKRVVDNIVFSGFHSGIHAYGGSDASLKNMEIEGNVIFNNGLLAQDPVGFGILVGGTNLADNITIRNNYLYNPTSFRRSNNLNPSYRQGTGKLTLVNNLSVGSSAVVFERPVVSLTAEGNTFIGDVPEPALTQLSLGSNKVARDGAENRVFIRRNHYEPNRFTVVVFNSARERQVAVNLPDVRPGQRFEVVDIQNYFGGPVASGVTDNSPILLPMVGAAARPTGSVPGTRHRTDSDFGVFQVTVAPSSGPDPLFRTSKSGLNFSWAVGSEAPAPQTFSITATSGAVSRWSAETTQPWMRLTKQEGRIPGLLQVTVSPEGLASGVYEGEVVVRVDGTEPHRIRVQLQVLARTVLRPQIDAVVSSASQENLVGAHSWMTIIGSNLSDAGFPADGIRVRIAGLPAQVASATPGRIVALTPSVQAGEGEVPVEVETPAGRATASVRYSFVAPALFWSGSAEPGLLTESPVRPGDAVSLWATGLGDGSVAIEPLAVGVTIADTPAEVIYAGLAAPGLFQINVVVPPATPERICSVLLSYSGRNSQDAGFLPVIQ